MQDRVGEDFDAPHPRLTKYGIFVELTTSSSKAWSRWPPCTTTATPSARTPTQIIAHRTRKTFSVGDRIRVVLDRIDSQERKLQFALVDERPTVAKRGKKRKRY